MLLALPLGLYLYSIRMLYDSTRFGHLISQSSRVALLILKKPFLLKV